MNGCARGRLLCIAVFCSALVGCSSKPGQATVSGTVSLDAQPLKSGIIRFVPTDGLTPTADTTISDGKFTAKVPPGEKRVEITAPKVVGTKKLYETPDSPAVDIVEELLPARYNLQSTLTITVVEGEQSKVVGTKKLYETPDSPTVDIVEELLPARYNLQSTLTITVVEGEQ